MSRELTDIADDIDIQVADGQDEAGVDYGLGLVVSVDLTVAEWLDVLRHLRGEP